MIACILAGGEGTRLRPISCRRPKPLTKLITRPVMGHMLAHLHACGVERAFVTLRHLPAQIRDTFGDGSEWGVTLSYYEETQPLGTAGGAAMCDFPEKEEILIVSGDAVCDFDFGQALAFHRSRGAAATILVSRAHQPLEYGVVLSAPDGRVTGFSEKPAWPSVRSDAVNTGIYILSPEVIRRIRRGTAADFSRDVFPEMRSRGDALYAFEPEGYWCDIGDCGAYLSCVHDALAGKIGIALPRAADGICALSGIPEGVQVCAPVYIGQDVRIGRDARIGPFTVLEDGARVERGAVIEGSVISGFVGANALVTDTVACMGSFIGEGAVVESGAVLGEGARVGAHTLVRRGVRIWPDCDVGEETVVRFSVQREGQSACVRFAPGARLEGAPDLFTPAFGAALGGALAAVGSGPVGLAAGKENAAQAFLSAVSAGVRAAGAQALHADSGFAALTAFAFAREGIPICLHADVREGKLEIRIFSRDGLPADEGTCRKLENLLKSGDVPCADAEGAGTSARLPDAREAYMRACLGFGTAASRRFGVGAGAGAGEASRLAGDVFLLMGAGQAKPGDVRFFPSPDGFSLEAEDEDGNRLDDAHTLACAFFALAACGGEAELPCPDDAPLALDEIAARFHKRAVRPSQKAGARDRLAKLPFLFDGVMRAAFLAAFLADTGQEMRALTGCLPPFSCAEGSVSLHAGRACFMRAAAQTGLGAQGVRFAPDAVRELLRVRAEGRTAEAAQALCEAVCERARRLDTDLKRQKVRKS